MLTRAKRGLIVIGNAETLKRDALWAQWLEWCEAQVGLDISAAFLSSFSRFLLICHQLYLCLCPNLNILLCFSYPRASLATPSVFLLWYLECDLNSNYRMCVQET